MKLNRDDLTSRFRNVVKKAFDHNQRQEDQFVIEYRHMDTDEVIGYHQSTFCQLTDDILQAKRYHGDNPYPQVEIISKNLKNLLEKDPDEGIFAEALTQVRKKHYGGLTADDIYFVPVYLDPDTEPQRIEFTEI